MRNKPFSTCICICSADKNYRRTVISAMIENGLLFDFDKAATSFRNECSALFAVCGETVRHEYIRNYIIKILLYAGLLPRDSGFAVIARLVETVAIRPDLELEYVINEFAETHGTKYAKVNRMIEKSLDAYDVEFVKRVTELTCSQPLTSKDILCDLAVFVRLKYFDGIYRDERSFGK